MGQILNETLNEIYAVLGGEIENLSVQRVVVGLFFTGVKLSNGVCGVSYTPLKAIPQAVCCPSHAASMPNAGNICGKNVRTLLRDLNSGGAIKKTIAVAALNALSQTCFEQNPGAHAVKFDADPFHELDVCEGSLSVIVGALVPYIKFMIKNGRDFRILELDKSVLKPQEAVYFVPQEMAAEAIRAADNLIITGVTLLNDTLEEILALKKEGAKAVVVGPTVSMSPASLFARGVSYAGGVYTQRADELLDVIAQAGSGYHFLGKYARKFTMSADGFAAKFKNFSLAEGEKIAWIKKA